MIRTMVPNNNILCEFPVGGWDTVPAEVVSLLEATFADWTLTRGYIVLVPKAVGSDGVWPANGFRWSSGEQLLISSDFEFISSTGNGTVPPGCSYVL